MEKYKGINIKIVQDESPESPRGWSNLGYFITVDRKYYSPDEQGKHRQGIIKETGERANSQEEHIKLIKEAWETTTEEKVLAIYPVVKYEHSGIYYSLGTIHGWDYSNNGFYIITDKKQKEIGTEKENFGKVVKNEIETYNAWLSGEVYGYQIIDPLTEEEIGSCFGYYGSDHEKNGLLSSARGEIDYYIKHNRKKALEDKKQEDITSTTLGTMLGHENETIRRNATSILKQLQK
jgi:hypothetical protein